MNTSISDKDSYVQICRAAAENDNIFRQFKRYPQYQEILEHCSREQGQAYLDEIHKIQSDYNLPTIQTYLDNFLQNDLFGDPITFTYLELGVSISPSTLRYIKVAYELWATFGRLDNLHITEIGGGYGGQCKVLSDIFNFASYTIIDLEVANMLQHRYLNTLGVKNVYLASSLDNGFKSDLAISNYAFSECHGDIQERYLEKILQNSARGYMTLNQIGPEMKPMPYDVLAEHLSGTLIDEVPNTHPENKILIWGTK
jgi:hypothetical protein